MRYSTSFGQDCRYHERRVASHRRFKRSYQKKGRNTSRIVDIRIRDVDSPVTVRRRGAYVCMAHTEFLRTDSYLPYGPWLHYDNMHFDA